MNNHVLKDTPTYVSWVYRKKRKCGKQRFSEYESTKELGFQSNLNCSVHPLLGSVIDPKIYRTYLTLLTDHMQVALIFQNPQSIIWFWFSATEGKVLAGV